MGSSELDEWHLNFESNLLNTCEKRDKALFGEGTILMGHSPVVAKFAYKHKLFSKKGIESIATLESDIGVTLPRDLLDFYKLYNGCSIFNGNVCIFGIRDGNRRDVKTALSYPFDILSANLERPSFTRNGQILVGFFKHDGGLIVMNLGQGVFKVNRDTHRIENEWESIFGLLDEIIEDRLKLP